MWVSRYEALKTRGYLLRHRYRPGWVASWLVNPKLKSWSCEDSIYIDVSMFSKLSGFADETQRQHMCSTLDELPMAPLSPSKLSDEHRKKSFLRKPSTRLAHQNSLDYTSFPFWMLWTIL